MRDLTEGDAARRTLRVHRALLTRPLCNDIADDDDRETGDLGIRRTVISTL